MTKSSNADISETENLFSIFYCVSKSTLNLTYFQKKDQSHSLSIKEIFNCETGSYLNVQKAMFHGTLRKITCQRVPNTADISMEPVSYHCPINLGKREKEKVDPSHI